MVQFVVFRDWDIFHYWPFSKVRWNQPNKSGFVTAEGDVLYPFMWWIRKVRKDMFRKKGKLMTMPSDYVHGPALETFFTRNVLNPDLYQKVLHVFANTPGFADFLKNPIKLPMLDPIDEDEFERRWEMLRTVLKDGDHVFCFDSHSRVSRFIAWFDQGVWSHVAGYIGDGMVCEAITSGVVYRSIDAYHRFGYRIGVYRLQYTPEQLAEWKLSSLSKVGDRYSWRRIVSEGFRKLFRRPPHGNHVTPNEMAVIINAEIVFVV
jgi:hypothetical protein